MREKGMKFGEYVNNSKEPENAASKFICLPLLRRYRRNDLIILLEGEGEGFI